MRRDSQREKVYQWEYHINASGAVPREMYWDRALLELDEWCFAVWQVEHKRLGLSEFPTPIVKLRKRNALHAECDPATREILLASGLRRKSVVLHELAHVLTPNARNEAGGWHGPVFVGVFIHLLRQYGGADETKMLAEAARCRVQVKI